MKMNYIEKIKGNISINANKKTANILDGTYTSIFKGKSLNFEDLREYIIGDNIKDIDWKASARSNNILIKRFIAEKKHNILFIVDSSVKMKADSLKGDKKSDVALYSMGTIAYLANKNGDYISCLYGKDKMINYFPFKEGLYNIEYILNAYESALADDNRVDINELIDYAIKFINKRMIVFIITDLDGMESVSTNNLKTLTLRNDVLFINVSDMCLFDDDIYDIEDSNYVRPFFLNNNELLKIEKSEKKKVFDKCIRTFRKYGISAISIDSVEEIVMKVVELLERHKYANIR